MRIKIQSSQDSFRDLIESGAYYVDKTNIIQEYLVDAPEEPSGGTECSTK